MKYLKEYKIFKESLTEFQEELIRWFGDDFFEKSQEDILNIKDILIELEDMDYIVSVGYTSITMIAKLQRNKEHKPQIYIKIDKPINSSEFYGSLGEKREEVNYHINRVISYLESNDWRLIGDETKFLNNPTNYQYTFEYDR